MPVCVCVRAWSVRACVLTTRRPAGHVATAVRARDVDRSCIVTPLLGAHCTGHIPIAKELLVETHETRETVHCHTVVTLHAAGLPTRVCARAYTPLALTFALNVGASRCSRFSSTRKHRRSKHDCFLTPGPPNCGESAQ
jgi:hypothetical protein